MIGIQALLADELAGGACARDVMFTIARPHLYHLENIAARSASFLRQCLGWCNDDEGDGDYASQLKNVVQSAVRTMQRAPIRYPARTLRRAASFTVPSQALRHDAA